LHLLFFSITEQGISTNDENTVDRSATLVFVHGWLVFHCFFRSHQPMWNQECKRTSPAFLFRDDLMTPVMMAEEDVIKIRRSKPMIVSPCTAIDYRRRICLAMDHISRHLESDLSLEEIAATAAFSKFHFHRIFKAVVGETVAEFRRRLRLERAANRLQARGEVSITRIALECGFSSSQNFATAFRRHFGLSPSAYHHSKQRNIFRNQENALSFQTGYSGATMQLPAIGAQQRKGLRATVSILPEYTIAYVRRMGPYGKATSEQAFAELLQWAEPQGFLAKGVLFGFYWDNPDVTPSARCRTDACISVPRGTIGTGSINTRIIAGGPHAVCGFVLEDDSFEQAWEEAFTWLIDSGYTCADRPCYERYHTMAMEPPAHKWSFDICIPLTP
jgi:AraC family transcriptional regulator